MSVPPKDHTVTNSLHGSVSKIPRLLKESDNGASENNSEDADAIIVNATDVSTGTTVQIAYTQLKVIGTGSFGVVYSATLLNNPTAQEVAVKKVLQDERYKNRELQILKSMKHTNVVALYYYFYSPSTSKPNETYLNLVQEFVPQTVSRLIKHYYRIRQVIPLSLVKLYSFQLLRGLAYIHNRDVCHRDIKPQNLLIDPEQGVLKICDFGSAKSLQPSEPNVSYICSRYYRAPELIFGAVHYTVAIDMWSAGCVVGELLLGRPVFPGTSGVDQLVEVIKILGTPTREQVLEMNPQYCEFKFPLIAGHPWEKVIRHRTNEGAFALLRRLLVYTPNTRATASEIMADAFFTDLIFPPPGHPPNATGHLPSGKPSPQFPTAFTDSELSYLPSDLVTRIQECKDAAACLPLSESLLANGSTTPTNYRHVRRVKSYGSRDQESVSSLSQNQLSELSTASKPSTRSTRQTTGVGPTRTRSMLASSIFDMRSHGASSHSKSSNRLTDSVAVESGQANNLLSQSVHQDVGEGSSNRSSRATVGSSLRSLCSKPNNRLTRD